ncbi:arsenical pump membrane protein-domain-containing protein [Haematococcus lacustris]
MAIDDFRGISALTVFALTCCVVVVAVLRPIEIRVNRSFVLRISYAWVPCAGALVMLACRSLTPVDVWSGVRGNEHIQPYGILILFMALAYLAASLDATGMFAWLALHITNFSRGHAHALFFLYFALSSVMTALTGNDVSIMTLTPIIIYFSSATGCDPMPYLVAEFMAANVWSMLLFVGNPTNIIVAQAYSLSFVGYTKWMALPTVASAACCILQLYLGCRRSLPHLLQLPATPAAAMLTDRLGAALGTGLLLGCLLLLALAPSLNWDMWLITLVCALLSAAYNAVAMVAWAASGPWGSRSSPGWALYRNTYLQPPLRTRKLRMLSLNASPPLPPPLPPSSPLASPRTTFRTFLSHLHSHLHLLSPLSPTPHKAPRNSSSTPPPSPRTHLPTPPTPPNPKDPPHPSCDPSCDTPPEGSEEGRGGGRRGLAPKRLGPL